MDRKTFVWMTVLFMLISTLGLKAQNDPEAKKWLDQASAKMSAYDNVKVDFLYVLSNEAEDVSQELSGDVLLEGDKYVVHLFGTTQIFDGKNTYTIIPENEEVNISPADLDDSNTFTPSKFFSFYESGYNYTMDKQASVDGKKVQFIKLVPIDSTSETQSILVGIETGNKHIYQIIELGANGTKTILTAQKISANGALEEGAFSFDEQKYTEMNYLINK